MISRVGTGWDMPYETTLIHHTCTCMMLNACLPSAVMILSWVANIPVRESTSCDLADRVTTTWFIY